MPGLYVHIPFCARRCPYCDFAVSTQKRADFRARYVAALKKELKNALLENSGPIETVFFGGGTPTELAAGKLNEILDFIRGHAEINADAEISLEANPENLDFAYLQELRAFGWNRLSLGAQSFDVAALKFLGRAHGPEKIETVVGEARRAGWENISLDLIYALPSQSRESWRQTLRRALALQTPHVSAYTLTFEAETLFGKRAQKGEIRPLESDVEADLMDDAAQILGESGLERYEVSNWAKNGFESRHNRNYWRGGDYLAVGCGAHGHKNGHRFWNERDTVAYVENMENRGSARVGEEILTPHQRLTELVALGLRSREGFSPAQIERSLGLNAPRELNGALKTLLAQGMLQESAGRVRAQNLALADGLAARLVG